MDIETVYDKLYRFVYFKVHNRETAEDITQETFLRYMRRYGDSKSYNIKLMYTIARNLCIDEFRKKTQIPFPENYPLEHEMIHHEDILEKIMVDEALASLSVTEKEMLLLRYMNDESVATISELCHCSRFSTYRTIKGAIKKFREFLEVKGQDE